MSDIDFYGFDNWMDFIHNVDDFEKDFLQVFPNLITINDKTSMLFTAFGISAENFSTLSITITEGIAAIIPEKTATPEYSHDYMVFFKSDKGKIRISDTHDEYFYLWEKIADDTYVLTNHLNTSVIWDGKKVLPLDMSSYQENLIGIYNSLPTDVENDSLDSIQQYVWKKLQNSNKEKN